MPPVLSERPLSQLALLYLTMAQRDDADLRSTELDAVVDTLHSRHFNLDRSAVRQVVLDVLGLRLDAAEREQAVRAVIDVLNDRLSVRQKQAVLHDLLQIARSDGVVLRGEEELLRTLTETWNVPALGVDAPEGDEDETEGALRPLYDLAFLYLVLAHGTDREFSDDERQLLLRKLREWQPALTEQQVSDVLEEAVARYARRADADAVRTAVDALKTALPAEQRMAALHDLTQIANADGVFLDSEEDLINELMTAWDVGPYAAYGRHGSKE
ncbi:MAG: hypothetical protein GVY18_09260 [Bacteroidetes bacterium]|jgi:uncharacterized tellurite resistance protein B-like protein|nr:hypothetical protein [Bacteroidota bacterium]